MAPACCALTSRRTSNPVAVLHGVWNGTAAFENIEFGVSGRKLSKLYTRKFLSLLLCMYTLKKKTSKELVTAGVTTFF